ncbi:FAD:protein FMN transferase [Lentilactobacillus otakiensis]|uniref:FAD:protein FMN transferase n=1 Tax=Lentilactobacillus otakiensis TaxID=481720 RepID=UPI003D182D74
MQTTQYRLQTSVINQMTIPFSIRLALKDEVPGFQQIFQEITDATEKDLIHVDQNFSTFRPDSLVSKFREGDPRPLVGSESFATVYSLAEISKDQTEGYFDPYFNGKYDPTGLVKGWAIQSIFNHRLRPLLADPAIVGVSLNGGGDIMAATDPHSGFTWDVGIEDPFDDTMIIGKYRLTDQGVATSGFNRRGEHIKRTPSTIRQVTIISDSLVAADVWATAGIAAGTATFIYLIGRHHLSGVFVDEQMGSVAFESGVMQS